MTLANIARAHPRIERDPDMPDDVGQGIERRGCQAFIAPWLPTILGKPRKDTQIDRERSGGGH